MTSLQASHSKGYRGTTAESQSQQGLQECQVIYRINYLCFADFLARFMIWHDYCSDFCTLFKNFDFCTLFKNFDFCTLFKNFDFCTVFKNFDFCTVFKKNLAIWAGGGCAYPCIYMLCAILPTVSGLQF